MNIKTYEEKKYIAIIYDNKVEELKACDLCCFKLGECRGAILRLGRCYIPGILDIYYKEV